MAKNVDYSDRVWCTLLWEFTRYAKERANDPNLLEERATAMKQAGMPINDVMWNLATPEIRTALKTIVPIMFLDYLRANPEILGTDDLIEWAKEKQANYPF